MRVLVASLFLWEGVDRYVVAWSGAVEAVRGQGLPMADLLTAAMGSLEIVGAIALLVPAAEALAAVLLALYCLLVAAFLHPSFSIGSVLASVVPPSVARDLALAGGLVAVALRDRRD